MKNDMAAFLGTEAPSGCFPARHTRPLSGSLSFDPCEGPKCSFPPTPSTFAGFLVAVFGLPRTDLGHFRLVSDTSLHL